MMQHSIRQRGNMVGTAALVVALLALVGAVTAIVYQMQVAGPRDEQIAEQNALIRQLTGVNNPQATNTLNARYTDANNDLLADAPAADQQIDPPTLKFCFVAVEDHTPFKEGFKPLMDAISQATGKPVEYVEYESTEEQVRAVRAGELHIAGLNTGAVPLAVCTAGFVPVAMMADAEGNASYNMQIITRSASPVQSIQDLKGRELTFTEMTSNSGYKAPIVILREEGLLPGQDYMPRYSQGHTRSIEGIKMGRYETAAVASDVLKRETGQSISPGEYRVVFTSTQTFPPAGLGVPSTLKPELAEKIRQVMLAVKWEGTALAQQFGQEGRTQFVPIDYKKDWDYVRRIDDAIGYTYVLREATTQPAE